MVLPLPPHTQDKDMDFWTQAVTEELRGGVGAGVVTGTDDQGRPTVGNISLGYENRFLLTAYGTDASGANFADTPQGLPGTATALFQGLRNQSVTTDTTNPADYTWRQIDTGGRTPIDTGAFYSLLGGRDIRWTFDDAIFNSGAMRTPAGDWGIQSWNYRTNDDTIELIVNTTGLNVTGTGNATINLTLRGANNTPAAAGYALLQDGSGFADNGDGTSTITLPVTNATHLNILNNLMRQNTVLLGNNLPGRLRNSADQQIEVFSGELQVDRFGGQPPANAVADDGSVIDLDNLGEAVGTVTGAPGQDGTSVFPVFAADAAGTDQSFTAGSREFVFFFSGGVQPTLPLTGETFERFVGANGMDGANGNASFIAYADNVTDVFPATGGYVLEFTQSTPFTLTDADNDFGWTTTTPTEAGDVAAFTYTPGTVETTSLAANLDNVLTLDRAVDFTNARVDFDFTVSGDLPADGTSMPNFVMDTGEGTAGVRFVNTSVVINAVGDFTISATTAEAPNNGTLQPMLAAGDTLSFRISEINAADRPLTVTVRRVRISFDQTDFVGQTTVDNFSASVLTTSRFIGTFVGAAAPANVGDYTWSRYVGNNGMNGTDAPRSTQVAVYVGPLQAAPSAPTATSIDFATRMITGLTTSPAWQDTPIAVDITNTTMLFYTSVLTFTEATLGGTQTVTASTPVASINFGANIQSDNFVAGTSGWQIQRDNGDAEFNTIILREGIVSANALSLTDVITRTLSSNNYRPRSPALGPGPAEEGYSLEANDGIGYFEELRGDLTGTVTAPSAHGTPVGRIQYFGNLETREYLNAAAGTALERYVSPDGTADAYFLKADNPVYELEFSGATPTVRTASILTDDFGFDTEIDYILLDRFDVYGSINNPNINTPNFSTAGTRRNFGIGIIVELTDDSNNVFARSLFRTRAPTQTLPTTFEIEGTAFTVNGSINADGTLFQTGEVREFGITYSSEVSGGNVVYRASDVTLANATKLRVFVAIMFNGSDSTADAFTVLPFDVIAGVLRDSETNYTVEISAGTAANVTLTQGAA